MHSETYLKEVAGICAALDPNEIERMAAALSKIEGRVYVIGLGGSLANAIHMAADLRKLCWIDAHAPNEAEMSAWINDQGPEYAFHGMLHLLDKQDALFVLSVGGGTQQVSPSIWKSVGIAYRAGVKVFGIVGPKGGITAEDGDYVIKIPAKERVTPHTEAFQAVIWHLLVSHPLLQKQATKW